MEIKSVVTWSIKLLKWGRKNLSHQLSPQIGLPVRKGLRNIPHCQEHTYLSPVLKNNRISHSLGQAKTWIFSFMNIQPLSATDFLWGPLNLSLYFLSSIIRDNYVVLPRHYVRILLMEKSSFENLTSEIPIMVQTLIDIFG